MVQYNKVITPMNGNPLRLRTLVSRSGYRWAKVDASGFAKWVDEDVTLSQQTHEDLYLTGGSFISLGAFKPMVVGGFEPGDLPVGIIEKKIGAEATSLFREFASTPCTMKGIKGFANKWGPLGTMDDQSLIKIQARDEQIQPSSPRATISAFHHHGEPAELWVTAIQEVSNAVDQWERSRNPQQDSSLQHPLRAVEALITVQNMVNSRLKLSFSPRLEFADSESETSEAEGWKLYFEPLRLIDLLWFQFALAIRGNVEHRQCIVCGTWFEIAPGSGRKDKKYCTNVCQMRAYRRRKAGKT
jgi:predicted nucleic acid-binding Zn ribbon protein